MSRHLALFYRDDRDLLDRIVVLLGSRPAVLVCGTGRAAALGDRALALSPRVDIHRRPAAALAVHDRLAARYPDAVVITEPETGSGPADWLRAARHEAAANLSDTPGDLVCLYRADAPEPLRTAVIATHPHLVTPDGVAVNPGYTEPATTLRRLEAITPVPPPAAAPGLTVADSTRIEDLGPIRRQVTEHLAEVPTLVRTDFVAAVNEVLTNAYLHGRPPLRLVLWAGADRIECRITDHGPGHDDPTAGYRPYDSATRTGLGLWLARQTCDDLDMWHGDGLFTVRLVTTLRIAGDLRHAGAVARAEIAQARVDLFLRRLP
ncbi:anti-sigma regulatory factor (Ser/Thr protein kinase) [Actinoplanes tereljensis]|uniref:ATP-binding protein n=1 Tax=Paractinoplanes tereljensis TaxID=571912 RepID=UPI0019407E3A|nr:ATP-binding protein [Actinoplanes tereljensis]